MKAAVRTSVGAVAVMALPVTVLRLRTHLALNGNFAADIHLCKVAFTPSPSRIQRNIQILKAAVEADALLGGAIKFEGEMLDPPMFGKALQSLLRARALAALSPEDTDFALEILKQLPVRVIQENWPYGTVIT